MEINRGKDKLFRRLSPDELEVLSREDVLRALLAEREAMLAVLRKAEWKGIGGDSEVGFWPACPCCGRGKDSGHAPDCRLAAVLRAR